MAVGSDGDGWPAPGEVENSFRPKGRVSTVDLAERSFMLWMMAGARPLVGCVDEDESAAPRGAREIATICFCPPTMHWADGSQKAFMAGNILRRCV